MTSWTSIGTARYSATCATRTDSRESVAYASIARSAVARVHAPTPLPATISPRTRTAPTYQLALADAVWAPRLLAPRARRAWRSGYAWRKVCRSRRQREYGSVVDYLPTQIRRVRYGPEASERTHEYQSADPRRDDFIASTQSAPPSVCSHHACNQNDDHGDSGGVVVRVDRTTSDVPWVV